VKHALNYFCANDEAWCVAQNAWEGLSARQWQLQAGAGVMLGKDGAVMKPGQEQEKVHLHWKSPKIDAFLQKASF